MTNEEFIDFVVTAANCAEITYTTFQEDNGSWTCWSNELTLSVNAPTREQMLAEMSESLKTWADSYVNNPEMWGSAHPELLAYAVKVLTDEEFHSHDSEVPVRKYTLYLKDCGDEGLRYTNVPKETSDDEILPPKYWEHKRDFELHITDADLDETEEE